MLIEIVPMLKDNYGYILHQRGATVVIDPSEAAPVERALNGRTLRAIWCTHHHPDHTGGITELARLRSGLEIIGSKYDYENKRIPLQTRGVGDGDILHIQNVQMQIMEVPGHTRGAIAYKGEGSVFTGDTLFLAGCGRVFEGTMAQMFASLQKLAALPPHTQIYCGHEYTENNLKFAAEAEPDNTGAISARQRALKTPSVPGTMADELATNPFLRAKDAAEFAARRQAKDNFK